MFKTLKISNPSTSEQIVSNRFLVKEEVRANTVCSFRRKVRWIGAHAETCPLISLRRQSKEIGV